MDDPDRRSFLLTVVGALLAPVCGFARSGTFTKTDTMYGLIGKMTAQEGRRDELINILLDGTAGMPGCLSYVVAKDLEDDDAIWISEVWASQQDHEASLQLASVRDAIAKGRPLIASFGERFETQPVGGHGLPAARQ